MNDAPLGGWNVAAQKAFRDLPLRPAFDLLARILELPAGALAVQMPGQHRQPSHRTLIEAAEAIRPVVVSSWAPFPGSLPLPSYAELSPHAEVSLWETEYLQRLDPTTKGATRFAFSSPAPAPGRSSRGSTRRSGRVSKSARTMRLAKPIRWSRTVAAGSPFAVLSSLRGNPARGRFQALDEGGGECSISDLKEKWRSSLAAATVSASRPPGGLPPKARR